MRITFLIIHFALRKSCKDCIFFRHRFPKTYKCIYYDIPITEEYTNCTKYKLKNIDW
jgi:hypothetical protein